MVNYFLFLIDQSNNDRNDNNDNDRNKEIYNDTNLFDSATDFLSESGIDITNYIQNRN